MSNIKVNVPGTICIIDPETTVHVLFQSLAFGNKKSFRIKLTNDEYCVDELIVMEIDVDDAETLANAILREVRDLKGCSCVIDAQCHCQQKGGV